MLTVYYVTSEDAYDQEPVRLSVSSSPCERFARGAIFASLREDDRGLVEVSYNRIPERFALPFCEALELGRGARDEVHV